MSYQPTPEKLANLGFVKASLLPVVRQYHSHDELFALYVYVDGTERTEVQEANVLHGQPYPVYVGRLPSEAFFDELLVSVGHNHPPDRG